MMNGFGDAGQIDHLRCALASEFGVRVGYHGADISKPNEIAEMVKRTHTELGSLDILVNNAGIQFTADIEDFPEERWDAIIAINIGY
jgi:3-hydroxybutyrate dehydrogenase